jgi:hypothetical protein
MSDQVIDAPIEPVEVVKTEAVIETNEEASAPEKNAETTEPTTEAGADGKEAQAVEKTYSQKEYDEATAKIRKKAEAVAERRALKVYAEKLEAMQQKPVEQVPQKPASNGKPTIAQFGDDVEGYVEAVAEWKMQQRDLDTQRNSEEQRSKKIQSEVLGIYEQAEKEPNFDREVFDELPITDPMAFAIKDSDIAPKLMLHFSENPKEAIRISNLPPARQAAEIGKLEVKLSEPVKIKTSNAPAPIKPVGSRGSSTRDPNTMSQPEFEKWLYSGT